MSEENVEIVRQPVSVRASSRRRLEERLGLRFPRAYASVVGLTMGLRQRSRLRRALARRGVRLALEANNRGDFEAAFYLHAPEVEWIPPQPLAELGFDSSYRGRQARIDFQRRWFDEWGEFRFEPEELIDAGDGHWLVIGSMGGSGLTSGAPITNDWGMLFTISRGRVIREQGFFDRAQALTAAGLRE